jgi:ribokinase
MNSVLVIGSSNTDMVVKTLSFPNPGETVLGGDFFMFPGGKGANQAVAAARMGASVSFICATGDDNFGKQAIEGYAAEGIATDAIISVPDKASGIALITVNEKGENEIVVAPGANAALSPEQISSNTKLLLEADIILTQLEIPLETIHFISDFCRLYNKQLILNPAPAQKLKDTLLNGLFAITPNQSETQSLTGVRVVSAQSANNAAKVLLDKGVKNVVITLGADGVYYLGEFGELVSKPPKVNAVDTTAAGDVFNGVLAAGLAKGLDWKESLDLSNTAAAISVTRMGAQNSAPYLKELQ